MKRSTPLALVLVAGLGGCGLGTEIGNGFKSGGGSDDSSSGANKKTSQAGTAAPETQGDQGAPEMPSDAKTANGKSDADTVVVGSGSSVDPAAAAAPPPLDLRMLYTSCASPFANIPHQSVVLSEVAAGKAPVLRLKADWLDATARAAAHWVLKDDKDAVLAQIELSPPTPPSALAVMVFDLDHKPLGDTYHCGGPLAEGAAGSYEVPLLKDDKPFSTLSWKVDGAKLDFITAAGVTLTPGE